MVPTIGLKSMQNSMFFAVLRMIFALLTKIAPPQTKLAPQSSRDAK